MILFLKNKNKQNIEKKHEAIKQLEKQSYKTELLGKNAYHSLLYGSKKYAEKRKKQELDISELERQRDNKN